MRLRDLYSFEVGKDVIENALRALNDELERESSKYRYAYGYAYGKPHLYVCRVEDFDKELRRCRIIEDEKVFSTRQDLLNAIRMIRYAAKRT
jgi:hypothetical protein